MYFNVESRTHELSGMTQRLVGISGCAEDGEPEYSIIPQPLPEMRWRPDRFEVVRFDGVSDTTLASHATEDEAWAAILNDIVWTVSEATLSYMDTNTARSNA